MRGAASTLSAAGTKRWMIAAMSMMLTQLPSKPVRAQSPGDRVPPCCQDMWNPGWMQRDMWGPGRMGPMHRTRMLWHRAFVRGNIPQQYLRQANPLPRTTKVIRVGGILYTNNCAACHGQRGMGDGEAGKALNPSPALLAYMIRMPMAVDGYFMWSIAEGGKRFGTDMPAFKDTLKTDEIWKIITYMRAGFPPAVLKKQE